MSRFGLPCGFKISLFNVELCHQCADKNKEVSRAISTRWNFIRHVKLKGSTATLSTTTIGAEYTLANFFSERARTLLINNAMRDKLVILSTMGAL